VKLGLFFLGIILLGLAFEFVEHNDKEWGTIDLFLLEEAKWNPSSYVYFAGESLAYIFLALIIRKLTPFRHVALAYIVIESIDLIDFFVTKNGPWFDFYGWPITYNIIKVMVFVIFLTYEYARNLITS
jgi:hypothetical protein